MRRIILMPSILALCIAIPAAFSSDAARIVYTKSFPGSTPAYVWISVTHSGDVSYREDPDDDPERFHLEDAGRDTMFDLASQLDHFKRPLESGLKVANMGVKTFRWEDGGETNEQKFNYSLDESAKALHDWFEAITETERLFAELKRSARHDKLGVHDALIRIEQEWNMRRLTGAEQFLPLLDQIAQNEIYLHMARQRAAVLGEQIRAAKAKSQ
ncbi:MAG TPA: hypothetical protein VMT15_03470 [Bryobacteraceae bacterium]|nr:hypothetical protein [Bryobacteraceae bacterium]